VQVGDYVLVHTGFAIGVIDEEEAQETLRLLEELAEFYTDEMVAVETVQSAGSGPEHEVH
jgi:hydrogenase expression/formation protein HypC